MCAHTVSEAGIPVLLPSGAMIAISHPTATSRRSWKQEQELRGSICRAYPKSPRVPFASSDVPAVLGRNCARIVGENRRCALARIAPYRRTVSGDLQTAQVEAAIHVDDLAGGIIEQSIGDGAHGFGDIGAFAHA